MDATERGQADVSGGPGLFDRKLDRRGARLIVACLALGAPETHELVGLGLQIAETAGRLSRTADVPDRRVEAAFEPCELAEHRVTADAQPGVVHGLEVSLDLVACVKGPREVSRGN